MHYLSILAIFKNESHVIEEWIQHYLNEGVDHFYLINNGSTDDFESKIEPFLNRRLITLLNDDKKWAQLELTNRFFEQNKSQSEWFLICDLDEFLYSRRKYKTISQFLKSLSSKVGSVQIPWKMFGSSGFIEQPKSVSTSFTKRCLYDKKKKETMFDDHSIFGKSIIRSKYTKSLHIHFSDVGDSRRITADKKRIKKITEYVPISERILKRSYIHLNHYPIQSLNWFIEIKTTRGAAHLKKYENFRDMKYFEQYDSDSNELLDDELAKKWEERCS